MPPRPNTAAAVAPPTAHQPWFQGAPVTKLLCVLWVVGFIVYQNGQQPAAVSVLLFASTGELVIGILFLAQFLRRLERELGSRKFVFWASWTCGLVLGLEGVFALTTMTMDNGTTSLPSGPYYWIGGVLYWYYAYVPRLHPRFVSILGVSFSEKSLQLGWGIYLACSQGMPSVIYSLLGFVSSMLFFILPLPDFPPDILVKLLPWESLGSLLLLDPPPKMYAPLLLVNPREGMNGAAAIGAAAAAAAAAADNRPPAAPVAPAPPPQAAIDQLTAMGFDEGSVRRALQNTNNNVERAADRLLVG